MRNKKAIEAEAREKHLTLLKEKKKKRRGALTLERNERGVKPLLPTILIVCEGENTEKSYFEQFRLPTVTLEVVGKGYNTLTLVKEAIRLSGLKAYEQVWCVFDKDSFPKQDFNAAVDLCIHQGFGAAYSNQAFEYWLILHFNDHQGTPMDRKLYAGTLNKLLKSFGVAYDKESKIITEQFFEVLMSKDLSKNEARVNLAISRAIKNSEHFLDKAPADRESSTTVYKLVGELLKFMG